MRYFFILLTSSIYGLSIEEECQVLAIPQNACNYYSTFPSRQLLENTEIKNNSDMGECESKQEKKTQILQLLKTLIGNCVNSKIKEYKNLRMERNNIQTEIFEPKRSIENNYKPISVTPEPSIQKSVSVVTVTETLNISKPSISTEMVSTANILSPDLINSIKSALTNNKTPMTATPKCVSSIDDVMKSTKKVESNITTLTRILTRTTVKEKPVTLFRELTSTLTCTKPVIKYKVVTHTEISSVMKTETMFKTVTESLKEKKSSLEKKELTSAKSIPEISNISPITKRDEIYDRPKMTVDEQTLSNTKNDRPRITVDEQALSINKNDRPNFKVITMTITKAKPNNEKKSDLSENCKVKLNLTGKGNVKCSEIEGKNDCCNRGYVKNEVRNLKKHRTLVVKEIYKTVN